MRSEHTRSTGSRQGESSQRSDRRPLVCLGETLEQWEAGGTEQVLASQPDAVLELLRRKQRTPALAYEPVGAIGTSKTATDSCSAVQVLIPVHSWI